MFSFTTARPNRCCHTQRGTAAVAFAVAGGCSDTQPGTTEIITKDNAPR
jgi:hypothetical protein